MRLRTGLGLGATALSAITALVSAGPAAAAFAPISGYDTASYGVDSKMNTGFILGLVDDDMSYRSTKVNGKFISLNEITRTPHTALGSTRTIGTPDLTPVPGYEPWNKVGGGPVPAGAYEVRFGKYNEAGWRCSTAVRDVCSWTPAWTELKIFRFYFDGSTVKNARTDFASVERK